MLVCRYLKVVMAQQELVGQLMSIKQKGLLEEFVVTTVVQIVM